MSLLKSDLLVKDKVFRLQNIDLNNFRSAFKINTDGVLLAAWVRDFLGTESVLEIGTGTGVIACIIKSCKPSVRLDAIEPDRNSYLEALSNFEQNGFEDIKLRCLTVQDLITQKALKHYDCIVCNPPYFMDSTLPMDSSLWNAKHNISLGADKLAEAASLLCVPGGRVYLIVPFIDSGLWQKQFYANSFELSERKDVKGREDKPFIRSLLCFKLGSVHSARYDSITLFEDDNRKRSDDYNKLVGDLYLK